MEPRSRFFGFGQIELTISQDDSPSAQGLRHLERLLSRDFGNYPEVCGGGTARAASRIAPVGQPLRAGTSQPTHAAAPQWRGAPSDGLPGRSHAVFPRSLGV